MTPKTAQGAVRFVGMIILRVYAGQDSAQFHATKLEVIFERLCLAQRVLCEAEGSSMFYMIRLYASTPGRAVSADTIDKHLTVLLSLTKLGATDTHQIPVSQSLRVLRPNVNICCLNSESFKSSESLVNLYSFVGIDFVASLNLPVSGLGYFLVRAISSHESRAEFSRTGVRHSPHLMHEQR